MSILAKLEQMASKQTYPCPVAGLLLTLPEKEAVLLATVLNGPTSTREIHRALKNEVRIGRESIGDHRAKRCPCYESKEQM